MSQTRVGCYACFQTLHPKDKNLQLRSIVKCENCGAFYHATCCEGLSGCYRCGQKQFHAARVARPSSTVGITKPYALTIQPSTVINLEGQQEKTDKIGVVGVIVYFAQFIWAILFAFVLILIAVMIGSYGHRIVQLPILSVQSVMDALFRTTPPSPLVIVGAVLSGLIAGFVFYSRPQPASRNFTFFLGGFVTFVVCDLLLFDVNPVDIALFAQDTVNRYLETLWAQAITAAAVFLLIPIHSRYARIKLLPASTRYAWLKTLYGWIRLLIVGYFLSMVVVNLVNYWLPTQLNQPRLAELYPGFVPAFVSLVSISTATVVAVALVIMAIGYWSPQFRQVQWHLGVLRLLLFVIALVATGWLYRVSPDPQALLMTIELASVLMLLMIPVQRTLS